MNYSQFPKFIKFCEAQQRFEGGNQWTTTNPSNIKCDPNNRQTWHHLAINSSHNFCVFPDRATGILAHYENIYNICVNASAVYNFEGKRQFNCPLSGDLTIEQMISIYAPATDGNQPLHYATVICSWAGLKITDTMKSLLDNTPVQEPLIQNPTLKVTPPTFNIPDNRTWWEKFLDTIIEFFSKKP